MEDIFIKSVCVSDALRGNLFNASNVVVVFHHGSVTEICSIIFGLWTIAIKAYTIKIMCDFEAHLISGLFAHFF